MTIIRDMPHSEEGGSWLLLSQVEHARVAGEIAAVWGGAHVAPLMPREDLVAAVFHHDDGWLAWEQQPEVDPASGAPYPFTDMPEADKFDLWRKSIDIVRSIGLLPGVIVTRHFIGLELGTNRWQKKPGHTDAAAQEFVDQYTALANAWLADWTAESPNNTESVARTAREWLQIFDVLSLWLCMKDRQKPEQFELPSGSQIVLTPQGEGRIQVEPWPFVEATLQLEISGRQVPHRQYSDAADLASETGNVVQLRWQLVPQ
jgi:hypothetical protein